MRIGRVDIALGALALALALGMPAARAAAPDRPPELALDVANGTMLRLDEPIEALFVANPAIADVEVKSPRLINVFARAPGETTLYAVGADDEVVLERRIVVSHNLTRLQEMIARARPDARIEVSSLNGSILLTGRAPSAGAVEDVRALTQQLLGETGEIVNAVEIASPLQVNLRVRIAEVSRDVVKQLGVSWEAVRTGSGFVFQLATGALAPGAGALAADALLLGSNGSELDVNALLDALDTEGLITVLAEPNLTAMSGESANFLAGGEFPIPVPQDNGVITIDYRRFGVSLSFVPVVLEDNRIHLAVLTEVSQLSSAGSLEFAGFSVPALTTRQAETAVQLGSGQSFAIAGLLSNRTNQDVRRFPGLGDIPVLGALFRSTRFQKEETELVVIVTPYLVRPADGPLSAPTDGFRPAGDFQRVASGAAYTQRAQGPGRGPVSAGGRDGPTRPTGFILR